MLYMQKTINYFSVSFLLRLAIVVVVFIGMTLGARAALASSEEPRSGQRVITIYDQGEKRVVLTESRTIGETLRHANVTLAPHDHVEPALDTEYTTQSYTVNIYRAYPVTIIDGASRHTVLTARSVAREIATEADIAVRDEDIVRLERSNDLLESGPGLQLVVERATAVNLLLYGAPQQLYTHAHTVGEFLAERDIVLDELDTVSTDMSATIEADMTLEIWRDGVQTVTVEESIDFPVRQVLDGDLPIGVREVETPGAPGVKTLVYEVMRQDGREVERKVIQEIVTVQPKEQVEVVGNKTTNPLTAGMGVNHFTGGSGVVHRETYYDLPMNVVMGACGGGGYTVRVDGAKVDSDGYILVAANLGNYPRCSIVETSMGLGKVYDTGGFAVRHPHGFDLATDWTKRDGI